MQRNQSESIDTSSFSFGKLSGFVIIGLIGTVAFDMVMYVDTAITGLPLHIPSVLGGLVVGESPFADPVGRLIHFGNGIGLALIFGFVALPISKKIARLSTIAYGIIFAIVETVVAVWLVMLPALGAGLAGLNIGPEVAVVTVLRHVAFGSVLGILAKRWRY